MMVKLHKALWVLLAAALSVSAGAQEIYKSVGEDGVVEYSDMPSQNAQEIEVDPNVVDVTPVKPPESRGQAAPKKAAGNRSDSGRLEAEGDIEVENDVDRRDIQRNRAKRRAAEQKQNENRPMPRPGNKAGPGNKGGPR